MSLGSRLRRLAGPFLGVLFIGIAGAILVLGEFRRIVPLDRSPVGFEGLAHWLVANGVPVRTIRAGTPPVPVAAGLRILPLHDADLDTSIWEPEARWERLMETSERDITRFVLEAKLDEAPTLVVLPKWRRGVRELGLTHRDLLVPLIDLQDVVEAFARNAGVLVRPAALPEAVRTDAGPVTLVHPQLLTASFCTPLIGERRAMLVGHCSIGARSFWVLSDPDFMNNHGLTQGANAAAALAVVQSLAGGGAVVVDFSTGVRRPPMPQAGREWTDLLRFFAYPFSVIWLATALFAALAFWRAWWRDAPADRALAEESAPEGSRRVAIEAKARLLRLAGHDAALLRAWASDRVQALSVELLGAHRRPQADGADALLATLRRRDAALAAALTTAAGPDAARPGATPGELVAAATRLSTLIERTRDEFGRPAARR
jgi:hypothetical protein